MELLQRASRYLRTESSDRNYISLSYQMILRRKPKQSCIDHYLPRLRKGLTTREALLDALVDSQEFAQNILHNNLATSLHEGRIRFIRGLPAAERIVDLGGSAQDNDHGAMVAMGYPYPFRQLTIVDLPVDKRHRLYQNNQEVQEIQTHMGKVDYLYQSMTDLRPIPDETVDLVYSGQSIEHVTREDAAKTYAEVLRVLKPGGYFCLDTPNGRITRLQQAKFIDPDHKIEYTHSELRGDLEQAGFKVRAERGLGYAGPIKTRSEFSARIIARNCGEYSAIEDCYLLAYVCQK